MTVRDWVISVSCCAIVCTAALAVTPKGRVKKTVRLVCALVMTAAVLSPLAGLDLSSLQNRTAELESEQRFDAEEITRVNETLSRLFIEERCAAYILDKAGAPEGVSASVTARWNTDGWFEPWSVVFSGTRDAALRDRMSDAARDGLGIPPERQKWSGDDG